MTTQPPIPTNPEATLIIVPNSGIRKQQDEVDGEKFKKAMKNEQLKTAADQRNQQKHELEDSEAKKKGLESQTKKPKEELTTSPYFSQEPSQKDKKHFPRKQPQENQPLRKSSSLSSLDLSNVSAEDDFTLNLPSESSRIPTTKNVEQEKLEPYHPPYKEPLQAPVVNAPKEREEEPVLTYQNPSTYNLKEVNDLDDFSFIQPILQETPTKTPQQEETPIKAPLGEETSTKAPLPQEKKEVEHKELPPLLEEAKASPTTPRPTPPVSPPVEKPKLPVDVGQKIETTPRSSPPETLKKPKVQIRPMQLQQQQQHVAKVTPTPTPQDKSLKIETEPQKKEAPKIPLPSINASIASPPEKPPSIKIDIQEQETPIDLQKPLDDIKPPASEIAVAATNIKKDAPPPIETPIKETPTPPAPPDSLTVPDSPLAPVKPLSTKQPLPKKEKALPFLDAPSKEKPPLDEQKIQKKTEASIEAEMLKLAEAPAQAAPIKPSKTDTKEAKKKEEEEDLSIERSPLKIPVTETANLQEKEEEEENIAPPPSFFPFQPILATSTLLPAYTNLPPDMNEIFEKMVGVMTVMEKGDIKETTFILNGAQFSSSVFFGSQITITAWESAPHTYNIVIAGSKEAVKLFNSHKKTLEDSLPMTDKKQPSSKDFSFAVHSLTIQEGETSI